MTEINRTTLKEGDQLSQRDAGTNLWHDITKFYVDENAPEGDYRRDILGSDVKVLDKQVTERQEPREHLTSEQTERLKEYKAIIALADKYLVTAIHVSDPAEREKLYLYAREQYAQALEFKNTFNLGDPDDFVKIVDQNNDKYVLIALEQAIEKIDGMYARDIEDRLLDREADKKLLEFDIEDSTEGNCPNSANEPVL